MLNFDRHTLGPANSSRVLIARTAEACSSVPEMMGKAMAAGRRPGHSPAAAAHCTRMGRAH